ncbi:hypothetical protein F4810DRAFT_709367 [Camillea tinctor]|nr:hypothetical protein F4810DRAFT_709367 [Camillea tinctor]
MANSSYESSILPLQEPQPRSSGSFNTQRTQSQTHSSTLDQSQSSISQHSSYRSRYSLINDAKGRDEKSEFYTDEDVLRNEPQGLPAAAASQVQYPNINYRRGFGHLSSIGDIYMTLQLSAIDDGYANICAKASEKGDKKGLNTLFFDKEQFISRCSRSPDYRSTPRPWKEQDDLSAQMENLMENGFRIMKYQQEARLRADDLKRFPAESPRAQEAHFEMLRSVYGLDEEALDAWRAADDMITTGPDTLYRRFENVLYTNTSWVLTGLRHLCGGRAPPDGSEEDPRMEMASRWLRWTIRVVMSLVCSTLLAVPLSVLYLRTLSNWGAWLIVLLFGAVFTFVIANIKLHLGYMFIAAVAYYAMMWSVLTNIG